MEMKDLLLANLGRNGHVDTLPIALEFYALYWGKCLSAKTPDCFYRCKYTGETIISFNTLAGCMIRMLPDYYDKNKIILSKLKTQEKKLNEIWKAYKKDEKIVRSTIMESFDKFFELYHSLANLMPFPFKSGGKSLNQFKGSARFRDFPDQFFSAVKSDLYSNFEQDLLFTEWRDYFDIFKTWEDFIELNFLQPFYKENAKKTYSDWIQLAPSINLRVPWNEPIAKRMNDEDREAAKDYIEVFLINAINIIENRAILLSKEFEKIHIVTNKKMADEFVGNLRKHIDKVEKREDEWNK